jgi:membrane-bound lytic murein transglycosylase F
VSLLNSGEGDVAAAGLTSDPLLEAWTAYASFTRPCLLTRMVLVLPASEPRPPQIAAALAGRVIHVPESSTAHHVMRLQWERLGPIFRLAVDEAGTSYDALILRTARGEIEATVAPRHLARALALTVSGVRIGPDVSGSLPMAWMTRQTSPRLLAALNHFLKAQYELREGGARRGSLYAALWGRYYGDPRHLRRWHDPAERPDLGGRISQWDEVFRQAADSIGVDWRLLAAVAASESGFDPHAVSSARAVGLMQVMPRPDRADSLLLHDPLHNAVVGARRLREIHEALRDSSAADAWAFAIATYHAGEGRLLDARRLASQAGKNPNRWEDAARGLALLETQAGSPLVRYGPFPGTLTVAYVKSVLSRYRHYARLTGGGGEIPPAPNPVDSGIRAPVPAEVPAAAAPAADSLAARLRSPPAARGLVAGGG